MQKYYALIFPMQTTLSIRILDFSFRLIIFFSIIYWFG